MEAEQRFEWLFGDPVQAVAEIRLGDHRKPGVAILVEHAGNDHHPVGRPARRRPGEPDVAGGQRLQLVDQGEQAPADRTQRLHRIGLLANLRLVQGAVAEFIQRAHRDMPAVPQAVAQQAQQEDQAGGAELVVEADEAPAAFGPGRSEFFEPPPEVLPAVGMDRGEEVLGVAVVHQHLDQGPLPGGRFPVGEVVGAVVSVLGHIDVVRPLDAGGAEGFAQTWKLGGGVRMALAAGVDQEPGPAGAKPVPAFVRESDALRIGDQAIGLGHHHQVRRLGDRLAGPEHLHALVLQRLEQRNTALGHQDVEPARIATLRPRAGGRHAGGRIPVESRGPPPRFDFGRRRQIDQTLGYAPDHRRAELHARSPGDVAFAPASGGLTCGPPPGPSWPDHRRAR